MDVLPRLRSALAERYEVERELGRGGMAIVYVARDLRHDRSVAIKVLRPELSVSLGADRFLREIQIAARLQHPHILALYDSGEADGLLYYVMPYVEGESLGQRLRRETQLPVGEALQLAREVAEALSYAHSHEVVHRDIKPDNIMLTGGHALVADFGIARAVSAAGLESLTDSGMAIGTPAYMSPEQGTGSSTVDGRSDVYSLGCVLYEMLAGEPPFSGPTGQAIIARHVSERPPSLQIVRPAVSRDLEDIVTTAIAKVPADRFGTAGQFADAIRGLETGAQKRRRLLLGQRRFVAAATALVLGFAGLMWWLSDGPVRPLDPSLYVIAPFENRAGRGVASLDGHEAQWFLSKAFRSWDDVSVANPFLVSDALRRRGDGPYGQQTWFSASKDVGAGRLIRGEIFEIGDGVQLAAYSYDVASGSELQDERVSVSPDLRDLLDQFLQLAAGLLDMEPRPAVFGTRSRAAGIAFVDGRVALQDGHIELAAQKFSEASRSDPRFADAHFWLAQVMLWSGDSSEMWSSSARRAAELRDQLSEPRDRALVDPLLDLADGRLWEACEAYRRLATQDSANFAAWFGLGECYQRDNAVLQDPASPSGWRFRRGYHGALDSYRRGLAMLPSFTEAFYSRLSSLLFVQRHRVRIGHGLAPDTATFGAYPSLENDTLAFVPYPAADVRGAESWALPPTHGAALARNREVLGEIVTAWAQAYPNSPAALQAVALKLENLGSGQLTIALREIGSARKVANTSHQQFELAVIEARLLLKLSEFERAQVLAESLLSAWPEPEPPQAQSLAALAALTGHAHRAASLLARYSPQLREDDARFRGLPLPVLEAREKFRGYASLGGPRDSLVAVEQRIDALVSSMVPPARVEVEKRTLLEGPAALAFAQLDLTTAHRAESDNYLIKMQWALRQGDTAAVTSRFARLREIRQEIRPGDVAIEMTYQEAWLLLQLGDTLAATELLDRSLTALPAFGNALLKAPPGPAALVRAMALRAELAARAGDGATARRWARPVIVLWADADPELRPVVDSMRLLTEAGAARP